MGLLFQLELFAVFSCYLMRHRGWNTFKLEGAGSQIILINVHTLLHITKHGLYMAQDHLKSFSNRVTIVHGSISARAHDTCTVAGVRTGAVGNLEYNTVSHY